MQWEDEAQSGVERSRASEISCVKNGLQSTAGVESKIVLQPPSALYLRGGG